jgi:hypothetical protein
MTHAGARLCGLSAKGPKCGFDHATISSGAK